MVTSTCELPKKTCELRIVDASKISSQHKRHQVPFGMVTET
jgi:hypothetical protein